MCYPVYVYTRTLINRFPDIAPPRAALSPEEDCMNLSIPDAAVELAVSETRLRRTLLENTVPTLVEFRQTRTGVRKTTVLTPDAVEQLRAFFAAPPVAAEA